jgi:hypothetical protein
VDYYDEQMEGRREQLELEHQAEEARARREARTAFEQREAWEARQHAVAPAASMYTSEPIPGRQSPFYSGDRYYAREEDARRARLDLAAEQQITQLAAMVAVRLAEQYRTGRAA